jgi:multidrug resistance efflux pump
MAVVELANETQKAQVALARAELAIARQQLRTLQAGERAQVRVRAKAEVAAREETYRNAREEMARLSAARGGVSASALDAARTRVGSVKADLDKAKAGLALIEEGSRAEDVEAAEAQVQAAEAKLQVAEAELAKTRLIAPTNARVLQVFAEPGELASPTTAQTILILADLSKRRVRAFVEELGADRIEVGRTATVTVDGLPGRTFTGKVALALPRMGKRSPQSDVPNPDYSAPGPQDCWSSACCPLATELRSGSIPEIHRPLTPKWGSHCNELSNGSGAGVRGLPY